MITFKQFITPINECVISSTVIDTDEILIKVRDRAYIVDLELMHEIIDGVEVLYLKDTLTDWSEGINEFGVGIVNSSLLVVDDEKAGEKSKKGKTTKISNDGLKIRTALCKKTIAESLDSILKFVGNDKKDVGIKGHTILASPTKKYSIELTSVDKPVVKELGSSTIAMTNHGINYPKSGYTKGWSLKSSKTRLNTTLKLLKDVKKVSDVIPLMATKVNKQLGLNPVRLKHKETTLKTSSIMVLNLNKLTMEFAYIDKEVSSIKYVNNLPKKYKNKISYTLNKI